MSGFVSDPNPDTNSKSEGPGCPGSRGYNPARLRGRTPNSSPTHRPLPESGRGSSQASGDVDIIAALRRPEGNQPTNRRVIETLGRYSEVTPEKIVIELVDGAYRLLGADEAVATADARSVLITALGAEFRNHESGLSQQDLIKLGAEHTPKVKQWAILNALEDLVAECVVRVTGVARSRTNPLRYWPTDVDYGTPV